LTPTPDRPGSRDLLFSAYLGLAAFLPRLYVAIAWAREPVWDGHYYDFGARRIAAGFGYSDGGNGGFHPWCHWPVGYSGVLAAAYELFGALPHVATILNAVIGALLAVFTHRLARYELSRGRARAAGIICAAHPGLIVYAALVMTETLSALAIVVAGWLWARHRREHGVRGAMLFGFALGLGALVHPSFLAYAPALVLLSRDGLADSLAWPNLRRGAALGAIATACMFVPVLPWTARNCRVMDRCALVSTNGGWNLAIGAFSRATGRFETLRASDGCAVVTGQVQQDACWRDLAIATIRSEFGRWIGLIPKKLGFTFDHESFPIEYLHEADPDRWSEDRRRAGRAFLTGAHRLLLTFAAVGVMPLAWLARRFSKSATRESTPRDGVPAAARRSPLATAPAEKSGVSRWATWSAAPRLAAIALLAAAIALAWIKRDSPFYLVAAAVALAGWASGAWVGPVTRWALFCIFGTIATHAVFFGEDRYHVVIVPMLCLLAARIFASDMPKAPPPAHTT
jgi:hypothetical protein